MSQKRDMGPPHINCACINKAKTKYVRSRVFRGFCNYDLWGMLWPECEFVSTTGSFPSPKEELRSCPYPNRVTLVPRANQFILRRLESFSSLELSCLIGPFPLPPYPPAYAAADLLSPGFPNAQRRRLRPQRCSLRLGILPRRRHLLRFPDLRLSVRHLHR